MATTADLLADAFGRVREAVHGAVDGLTPGQLAFRPDNGSNSIGWLVWHLTRIQDDHIADVAGTGQIWTSASGGAATWADRFGLPFAAAATGYGQGSEAVTALQVRSGELLTGYYDAVHQETLSYIQELTDADLDRVVDKAWDPPVTLGVRLVSVISDDLQHAGQAAYLRGIIERS
jgi:uncharacterized damage-inducible protein DinB